MANGSGRPGCRPARARIPRRDVESGSADIGIEVLPGPAPVVKIYADRSQLPVSGALSTRIRPGLDRLKGRQVQAALEALGVSGRILEPFSIESVNVAPPRRMGGMMLSNFLGFLLVIFLLNGGMYAAIDMTAGEKERRTIEMLLSSPASRQEIVLGKVLATVTAALAVSVLSILSFAATTWLGRFSGGSGPGAMFGGLFRLTLGGPMILLLGASIFPMAVMGAALVLAIAGLARSTREATSYLTPLMLFAMFFGMVNFLPGIESAPWVALVPIANFCRLIKQILLGDWSWAGLSLTVASNLVYAALAVGVAVRNFKRESILFRL